jgi:hypothetical protein
VVTAAKSGGGPGVKTTNWVVSSSRRRRWKKGQRAERGTGEGEEAATTMRKKMQRHTDTAPFMVASIELDSLTAASPAAASLLHA